jgi:putative ABC transport system ATP-binding protein
MVYQLRELTKIRASQGAEFRLVVRRLDIRRGEKIALVGPSGCGKSTLLDILAVVLSPSQAGTFQLAMDSERPLNIATLWRRRKLSRLSAIRKHHIGYVLQTGGLLPYITVRDNILLPSRLLKNCNEDTLTSVIDGLGIKRQLDKLPASLSVGERQRVAIARALAHRPSIVIADEPTASLDPLTAQKTMALFVRLTEELGLTLIVASHDEWLLNRLGLRQLTQRFRESRDGAIVESEFLDPS